MSDDDTAVQIFEGDDGLLLFGPEARLVGLDSEPALRAKPLPPDLIGRAGAVLGSLAQLQEQSARWVKLDDKTVQFMRENGVKKLGSSVIRAKDLAGGKGGEILKHVGFEQAGVLTPAAPAALAAMMTQMAIQQALDEVTDYLVVIDEKLDRLLKERKVEVLGQMGGVIFALDEADRIHESTGAVSSVTWSKVQAISLQLQTMQSEAIAQLHSIAEDVAKRAGHADDSAERLLAAQQDVPFWLGVLAKTLALQDRQYLLELARVADSEPDQLESHRQGIRVARQERTRRIGASLDRLMGSLEASAQMSNRERIVNPFSAQQVPKRAAEVNASVVDFARHVDLELEGDGAVSTVSWRRAVKEFATDAASATAGAAASAAARAGRLGDQLREKRERSIIEKAERIRLRRGGQGALEAQSGGSEPGGDPTPASSTDSESEGAEA